MKHYLVGYGVSDWDGRWFHMEYVVIKADSKESAKEKFEKTPEAKNKDRWKSASLSVERIKVY